MSYFIKPNLHPLERHSLITNNNRLIWLRDRFYKLSLLQRRKLFPFLKKDLQDFIKLTA